MVRVDTHIILLQTEGKLAGVNGLELMVILQVWPPPQPTVDDMRETLVKGTQATRTQEAPYTELKWSEHKNTATLKVFFPCQQDNIWIYPCYLHFPIDTKSMSNHELAIQVSWDCNTGSGCGTICGDSSLQVWQTTYTTEITHL